MNVNPHELKFQAVAASPGIAIGQAFIILPQVSSYENVLERAIPESQIDSEIERFNRALEQCRQQIINMQQRVQDKFDSREAGIFDAHLLIADDQILNDEVKTLIGKGVNAEAAYKRVITRYVNAIESIPDSYIRERANDIKDIASRVINNLTRESTPVVKPPDTPHIVIAHDLTPSETALMDRKTILGFAVETGSTTSHTAILARSMQMPAIVGLPHEAFTEIKNGSMIIVDGGNGELFVNPAQETLDFYRERIALEHNFAISLAGERSLPAQTTDNYEVKLYGNLETAEDLSAIIESGAGGVGLFRTEYMFINTAVLPSEDKQYQIYSDLARRIHGAPLVIRTLDIGGDKLESRIDATMEANPFLGLRAIRLCLKSRIDIFRAQLRAILRASIHGDIRVMFPMISCVEEVIEIKSFVAKMMSELKSENIAFNQDIKLGIMIEIPSAALIAEKLAPLVDFFSIGTNDLIQYSIAIDRNNDRVAYLYQPTHPAVLELIHRTVCAARNHGIAVSICGEMAGNPIYTPLLVGMGVHELSMGPNSIGIIRRIIRMMNKKDAETAVAKALKCTTAEEALKVSAGILRSIAPDMVGLGMPGF